MDESFDKRIYSVGAVFAKDVGCLKAPASAGGFPISQVEVVQA
jgi:hypothetical protein